jgi:DNA polymerase III epsilon subunit-like protein
VKFDVDFVDANCKRYRLEMPFNFVYRDVCQWFRLLQDLAVHDKYSAKLDTMLEHYGVVVAAEDRHTAKGDVLATAEVIKFIHRDLRAFSAKHVGTVFSGSPA